MSTDTDWRTHCCRTCASTLPLSSRLLEAHHVPARAAGHASAGMAEFFAKTSADVYAKSVYRNLLQAPSGATAAAAASAAATSAASAASAAAAATGKQFAVEWCRLQR